MPPTSDFVKKLFRMLEENNDEDLVSWAPSGDAFTVKDMNEFTKIILPRMFKHSNFASFVRQLNKYDFHKVKNDDVPGDGPQVCPLCSWSFHHPHFQQGNQAALENIKRKVPAARKQGSLPASSSAAPPLVKRSSSPGDDSPRPYFEAQLAELREQLSRELTILTAHHEELRVEHGALKRAYEKTVLELEAFKRTGADQDEVIKQLAGYFSMQRKFVMSNGQPNALAAITLNRMNLMSERAHLAGMRFNVAPPSSHPPQTAVLASAESSTDLTVPPTLVPGPVPPPLSRTTSSASIGGKSTSPRSSTSPTTGSKLRVRRATYVPGWAVPPRVLLVEDDLVSRRLSSKFLQVSGCQIDVAVDGLGAVSKMELEKYDLVLMDIVMPKLDGVSATSMIRRFDPMTPIISMTSNSKPSELLTYYSSGMNDILPKPFTRDGLIRILEVCEIHFPLFTFSAESLSHGMLSPFLF
ncbi:hypothetical protein DL93DRAFT_2050146 [Clavulina sp. PMI_390]|nr:hypothetical protein DL93DRAFT_2050146 [Clavulina sp. PMI_390]